MHRPNRLAREKSPYLLQHAQNPVDWYPWGEEAFAKARAEDKPIFLSIGYSTCHWCHVMERESFENETVAELLNRHFVSIKVDREERPDVDRIYMLFVQATTGSGGWPMSVFLTPDLRPFFGGTYFPPDNRYGRPGFKALLEHLAKAWRDDRARIEDSGRAVVAQLREYSAVTAGGAPADAEAIESGFLQFRRTFDAQRGGFGRAPKFPRAVTHNFLFRYHHATGNPEARDMVTFTLEEMAKGGMHDQLGGGFHRYSVDEHWFVPHFEKMLYDQAQLAVSYLEAYQITGRQEFAGTARDIFAYVLRDLTHPEGAFYSAEDADSVIDPAKPNEKGEGAFYVWSWDELRALLPPETFPWFCRRFGIQERGNVQHDPHHEFTGRNILYANHTEADVAAHFGVPVQRVEEALAEARRILLDARGRRVRPHRDDKILTAWNGLMISAFARGAQVLGDPLCREAAERAARFVLRHLYDPETVTLRRSYREGPSGIAGFLDDYACLAQALLDLYETTFETYYLRLAAQLLEKARELFEDREAGGFFSTVAGAADLVLRMKEDYDGAEPSGNAVAAIALLGAAALLDRDDFRAAAERTLDAFATRLTRQQTAVPQMMCAFLLARRPLRQIVVAGDAAAGDTRALLALLYRRFLPDTVLLRPDPDLPRTAGMSPVDGHAAAYVCENFSCKLPVTDLEELASALGAVQ
jgi:uncharacterized protein YyaL (SSP411 family)